MRFLIFRLFEKFSDFVQKKIRFLSMSELFFSELRNCLGYSFDVNFRARLIYDVFRVIPTLLLRFRSRSMRVAEKMLFFHTIFQPSLDINEPVLRMAS